MRSVFDLGYAKLIVIGKSLFGVQHDNSKLNNIILWFSSIDIRMSNNIMSELRFSMS